MVHLKRLMLRLVSKKLSKKYPRQFNFKSAILRRGQKLPIILGYFCSQNHSVAVSWRAFKKFHFRGGRHILHNRLIFQSASKNVISWEVDQSAFIPGADKREQSL